MGTCLEAAQRVLVFRVHGDHQHLDVGIALAHAAQHFQAIAARHVDIQQQDRAGGVAQHFAQLGIAAGFSAHPDVCGFCQRVTDAAAQDRVVIANHNIDQDVSF